MPFLPCDDPDCYDPDADDPFDRPDRPDLPDLPVSGHPVEEPDSHWDRLAEESAFLALYEMGVVPW